MSRSGVINAVLTAILTLACAGILTATARLSSIPDLEKSIRETSLKVDKLEDRVRELEIAASRDAGRRDAEQEIGGHSVPNLFRKN